MHITRRHVLVTGSQGFIGKNLLLYLNELPSLDISIFVRGDDIGLLPSLVAKATHVIHLAGENRPVFESSFDEVNSGLTRALCTALVNEYKLSGRQISLVFTSSLQAEFDNPYGRSKLKAEEIVKEFAYATGNPCLIVRLPGVFGKWCKPNYNSVVATFCHNITRNIPIQVNDPFATIRLVYIDDVIKLLLSTLDNISGFSNVSVTPEYTITVGELAQQIAEFQLCRSEKSLIQRVGSGFLRALYSTYVSYLPSDLFTYDVPLYEDKRGVFVEMVKTPDCGQFSFFTAHPGITRGGHYHHTKTEKFLVIKGLALFRFRHLLTGEFYELTTSGDKPQVVDTIPGWVHDITNVGDEDMVVMLWANEIFDRANPDTIASKV